MKRIFFIQDSMENQVSFYHLVCLLLALPFGFFYTQLICISFGLHTVFHIRKQKLGDVFTKRVLIQISIWLLALAGVLYSQDKDEAFSMVTRQWSMLLMPLLLSVNNVNLQKYKHNLLCIFGLGCTATLVYLYIDALLTIRYFHLPLSSLFTSVFMNHNFSMPLKLHATYLAMYTAFSLIIFLYLLFTNNGPAMKWFYVLCSIVLFAALVQLSSRSVFIALLVIINLAFPFFNFNGKKRLVFFITASLISTAVVFIIAHVDAFKIRYISELKTDLTDNVTIIDNTEPRLARWEAIVELVKQSPVIGYGSGAERKELREKFFEKKFYFSYLYEFNAHSEYLSILIRLGIIGLAVFLFILYFSFRIAFQGRDIVFLGFLAMISVVGIAENFLDMNRGVFFYSFFLALFLQEGQGKVAGIDTAGLPGNPA